MNKYRLIINYDLKWAVCPQKFISNKYHQERHKNLEAAMIILLLKL